MSGLEYVLLVFSTVILIIAVAADAWNKKNNR